MQFPRTLVDNNQLGLMRTTGGTIPDTAKYWQADLAMYKGKGKERMLHDDPKERESEVHTMGYQLW